MGNCCLLLASVRGCTLLSTCGLGTSLKGWRFQTLTLITEAKAGKQFAKPHPALGVWPPHSSSRSAQPGEKERLRDLEGSVLTMICSSLQTLYQQSHIPRLCKASELAIRIQIPCCDEENGSTTILFSYRISLNTYPKESINIYSLSSTVIW